MNTTPQAVTDRYVTNLINYGRNREFDIVEIQRLEHIVQGDHVGYHYSVGIVASNEPVGHTAYGATISQATRRALEKHGVTFR